MESAFAFSSDDESLELTCLRTRIQRPISTTTTNDLIVGSEQQAKLSSPAISWPTSSQSSTASLQSKKRGCDDAASLKSIIMEHLDHLDDGVSTTAASSGKHDAKEQVSPKRPLSTLPTFQTNDAEVPRCVTKQPGIAVGSLARDSVNGTLPTKQGRMGCSTVSLTAIPYQPTGRHFTGATEVVRSIHSDEGDVGKGGSSSDHERLVMSKSIHASRAHAESVGGRSTLSVHDQEESISGELCIPARIPPSVSSFWCDTLSSSVDDASSVIVEEQTKSQRSMAKDASDKSDNSTITPPAHNSHGRGRLPAYGSQTMSARTVHSNRSSDDDSFSCFNEQEMEEIERKVLAQSRATTYDDNVPPTADYASVESPPITDPVISYCETTVEWPTPKSDRSPPENNRVNDDATDEFNLIFGLGNNSRYFNQKVYPKDSGRVCSSEQEGSVGFETDENLPPAGRQSALDSGSFMKPNNGIHHGIEHDERITEVHPALYQPQPLPTKSSPVVHSLSLRNRPLHQRRSLSVTQVFGGPVNKMWENKFSTFNHLQSEIAHVLAFSDDNVVLSAPTGAGKTAVFEMAMARFFETSIDSIGNIGKAKKIVYMAPSKALCEERFEDWSARFGCIDVEVALVTGDGDPSLAFRDVASAHLIITTPEKWDSLTRRWTESFFLFGSVKLFLLDEVHLIADENRGCCLEATFCRMKVIQQAAKQARVTMDEIHVSSYANTTPEAFSSAMRVIAVSATLPNIVDLASFLDANEAYTFDDSYRPVPLTVHVVGQGFVGEASNSQFRFWSSLDRNIPDIIHRFSKRKPVLVFCHSKADTEKLADLLAMENGIRINGDVNSELAGRTKVSKLQRVLFHGIGYHHAGLELDDRRLVEKAFTSGKLRVLCATSTLAMGVNLPAHLVIIKGTKAWRGGGAGYQDLDKTSLLQMIGRAGRPGFDTAGTAVIMTDNKSKRAFEQLVAGGLEPAMSKLYTKLDEVINAEVSQKVITSLETAMDWLKTTLFFIQLCQNTSHFDKGSILTTERKLLDVCTQSIQRLQAIDTLTGDGMHNIFGLPASHIMSQHLVEYQAMQLFRSIPHDINQPQLLKIICNIEGLQRPVRRSEKRFLKEAHKIIRYKLEGPASKVTIQQPSEKTFVLLQAFISKLGVEDNTLRQEMNSMVEFACRMLAALEELSARGSRNGAVLLESLKLRRCFATCIWNADDTVLNQLRGVGPTCASSLRFSGIASFDDIINASPEQIEKAARRLTPFGANLRNAVHKIFGDRLQLSAQIIDNHDGSKQIICNLTRYSNAQAHPLECRNSGEAEVSYTLVAFADVPGGCLMYRRGISSPSTFKVDLHKGIDAPVSFFLIGSLVGLDETFTIPWRQCAMGVKRPIIRVCSNEDGRRKRSCNKEVDVRPDEDSIATVMTRSKVTPSPKSGSMSAISDRRYASPVVSVESSSIELAENIALMPRAPLSHQSQNVPVTDSGNKNNFSSECAQDWSSYSNATRGAESMACTTHLQSMQHYVTPWEQHSLPFSYPARIQIDQCCSSLSGSLRQVDACAPVLRHVSASKQRSGNGSTGTTSNNVAMPKSSWKNAKQRQMRTQQRAFVHKKDNPFLAYMHDPNQAERHLDSLTKQSNSSRLIPTDCLRSVSRAYENISKKYSTTKPSYFRPFQACNQRTRIIQPSHVDDANLWSYQKNLGNHTVTEIRGPTQAAMFVESGHWTDPNAEQPFVPDSVYLGNSTTAFGSRILSETFNQGYQNERLYPEKRSFSRDNLTSQNYMYPHPVVPLPGEYRYGVNVTEDVQHATGFENQAYSVRGDSADQMYHAEFFTAL